MTSVHPAGRALTAFVSFGAVCACSLLVDVSAEQCTIDADCVARGSSFAAARCVLSVCQVPQDAALEDRAPVDPRWACLGQNPKRTPVGPTATLGLTLTDVFTTAPAIGLRAKVCANLTDPDCASPVSSALVDSKGFVNLTLDTSKKAFDGYIDIAPELPGGGSPPVDGSDGSVYMPSRVYYTSSPIDADYKDDYKMVRFGSFATLMGLFDKKVDLAKAAAFLIAEDCNRTGVAGVHYGVDQVEPGNGFYFKDDQPSTTATETDISGIGGFANVPKGPRIFDAEVAATGQKVTDVAATARPGTLLYVRIAPAFIN